MTTQTSREKTAAEYQMSVPCEREYCEDRVFEERLVRVRAGDEEQRWCPDCVQSEFGLEPGEYGARTKAIARYVTLETVTAFLTGATLMLLVASVFVV